MFKYAYEENNLAVFYNALWSPPPHTQLQNLQLYQYFYQTPIKKNCRWKDFGTWQWCVLYVSGNRRVFGEWVHVLKFSAAFRHMAV